MQSVNQNSVNRATIGIELIIAHLKSGKMITNLPARGRKAREFKPLVVAKVNAPRAL